MIVHQKVMTQDFNNLNEFEQSGQALYPYMKQLDSTGLSDSSVQASMAKVSYSEIFYNNSPLQHFPVVKWFYKVTEPDAIDYDFEASSKMYYQNKDGVVSSDESYGYACYGLF